MAAEIAGLPFWELTFDEQGDPDGGQRDAFLAEVPGRGITDVIVFAHGWNNDHRIAMELYTRFFGLLAPQVPQAVRGQVGLAGVIWPSQRWSDEPIPDFAADGAADVGGGAAAFEDGGEEASAADPTLDPATLKGLKTQFSVAVAQLDSMAALLQGPADGAALAEFRRQLAEFSRLAAAGIPDDGEGDTAGAALETGEPRMLLDDPTALFERYRDALVANGVTLDDSGGGIAGFGDALGGLLNGAKEALRQATYWQMKNRDGTVGRFGLGPVLGRLPAGVRVHLVGHSFGARLVSFALAGLPAGAPSPVRAVTLLQGAFSHFAFASPLPFDAGRSGALAGMLARINGPLVACYSSHDEAVGTFYPLASFAAREDAAAANDSLSRWGRIGADGAQGVDAVLDAIRGCGRATPSHRARR